MPRRALTILETAAAVVNGPRRLAYGTPAENHARTAIIWTEQLKRKLRPGVSLDAVDVCLLNIGQKLSRAAHRVTRDTLVDLAGFSDNAGSCLCKKSKKV